MPRDFDNGYVAACRLVCRNWAAEFLEAVPELHVSGRLLPSLAGKLSGVRALTWDFWYFDEDSDHGGFFPGPSGIRYLRLGDGRLGHGTAEHMSDVFPDVETLVLDRVTFDEASWNFGRMRSLTSLVLLAPKSLWPGYVACLKYLTSLRIKDTELVSLPVEVTSLARLESIDLSGCVRFECDLEMLEDIVSLTSLDISGCDGGDLLSSFESLASLTSLDMSGCPCRVERLPASLKRLVVSDAYLQNGEMKLYAESAGLSVTELTIAHDIFTVPITLYPEFGHVGSMLALAKLSINSPLFLRSDVNDIGKLRALVFLSLGGCGNSEDDDYAVDVDELGNLDALETLDVSNCDLFVNLDLPVFGRLTSLTALNLRGAFGCEFYSLTGSDMGHLAALTRLETLDAYIDVDDPEADSSLEALRALEIAAPRLRITSNP